MIVENQNASDGFATNINFRRCKQSISYLSLERGSARLLGSSSDKSF